MRLFVAVWPDEPTRHRLRALERELGRSRGLRFVGPDRWHVTLRFLGDVEEGDVGPLSRALAGCGAGFPEPVECRLGPGTGWFPAVRILQLPAAGVDALAEAVRDATVPLVPEPPAAPPFNGHLTLARSKGRRLSGAALGEMSGVPFEAAFSVSAIDMVHSRSSPQGNVYVTVARVPLGPASRTGQEGR